MNTKFESADQTTPKPISSLGVLGARLTWVLLGPLALVGMTWGVVSQGTVWFTVFDAAFGAVVGLMLLGRWVEHRSGSATTLTGEPDTPEQFKRYMTLLPPLAASVWIVANVVGRYVLK
jgi:divalent metal cation (Fe/Co/Zn/Cd) transporter